MSDAAKGSHAAHGKPGSALGRFFVRLYALLILLVVVWTGYTAVAYLARFTFTAQRVPERLVDPLAQGMPASQPGAATQPVPTPAIAHYHRNVQDFPFTEPAGCSTSGCHTLLPHAKRKEVRAFANFHSTFLDCTCCHDANLKPPTRAVWVSNATGRQQDAPALLKLAALIEARGDAILNKPAEVSNEIISLLRESETAVGVDPPLHEIRVNLETSEPGSPVWRQAAVNLQMLLPNRIRGEYGARITPADVAARWSDRQSKLSDLTRQYKSASGAQRDAVNKQIHEGILAKPEACLTCHGGEPARFDLQQLGYSPQRIGTLGSTPIARMIEQIRQGQPFHLPKLLESQNGR